MLGTQWGLGLMPSKEAQVIQRQVREPVDGVCVEEGFLPGVSRLRAAPRPNPAHCLLNQVYLNVAAPISRCIFFHSFCYNGRVEQLGLRLHVS